METFCMHCRKLRSPRGRWVAVPEEKIAELRNAGRLTFGCCFACTREHFGPDPERRAEHRAEA